MLELQRLRSWSHSQQEELREEARRAIEAGRPCDSLLLNKICHNTILADSLYRGMTVGQSDRLLRLEIGETFTLLPTSFSRSIEVASWFFRNQYKPRHIPLFMLLKSPHWEGDENHPIYGFDLSQYFRENYFSLVAHRPGTFQEIITAGKFKVIDRQPLHEGRMLTIRQVGVYGRWNYEEGCKL